METSSFRQAIEAQFDCLSKKVIKRAVMKGYRDMKRREKRECSFSDLPDYQQERFGECDKYASDYTVFNVLGIEVWVENDKLSEALKALTEKKRNIILLSYFMDMADGEISHFINLPRSNVQYHRTKTLNVYRSAFFIPVIVSYVSITMVWQWLYNEDYGLINAFLGQLGLYQPPWLTSEKWAMPSVIIMSIWKNLGFNAVILLAGVQGISSEIYESADIDGANVVQKFFKITMPLLKPTIVFVTIISMINSFQAFDQIYVMTKGGPGTATQVVSYLIYMNAFQYFKQGYASAMAYILFIIVFIASIVQLRFSERNSI